MSKQLSTQVDAYLDIVDAMEKLKKEKDAASEKLITAMRKFKLPKAEASDGRTVKRVEFEKKKYGEAAMKVLKKMGSTVVAFFTPAPSISGGKLRDAMNDGVITKLQRDKLEGLAEGTEHVAYLTVEHAD